MMPKAARAKEAQNHVAAIDLRLKNPPATAQAMKPAAKPGGELDLSKLPQGTDIGPSNDKLPTEEDMGPGAPEPAKAPEKEETPKAKVGLGPRASVKEQLIEAIGRMSGGRRAGGLSVG